MQEKKYYLPKTIQDVFSYIEEADGKSKFIAGGTDIMVEFNKNPKKRTPLIDLSEVAELKGIKEENGYIILGAMTTHEDAAMSPLLQKKVNVLSTACGHVGSRQIRNLGTLGGNIVTSLPAADGTVALVSLGAECEVYTDANTSAWHPILDLFEGVGKSKVLPTHLLSRIRFKVDSTLTTSYKRLTARKALALPILCVGAALNVENGIIVDAKIAIAPVSTKPGRALKVEEALKGQAVSEDLLKHATSFTLEGTNIRTSAVRGGKEYREKVLPVYVLRALKEAVL